MTGISLLIGRDKPLCEDWLNIKVWLTRDKLASQLTSALAEHASRRTGITLTSSSVSDRASQPSFSQGDGVLYHTLRPSRPWTNPVRFRSPVGLSDAPSAREARSLLPCLYSRSQTLVQIWNENNIVLVSRSEQITTTLLGPVTK